MGNFLDAPMTDKQTSTDEDSEKGFAYGVSAMQGWRAQMEDDHIHFLKLPKIPDLALFGVFDGHGGDMVAHHTAANFHKHLLQTNILRPKMSATEFPTEAKTAFETALMSLDDEMRHMEEVETGQDQSGSTSVMTLLSDTHIVCANTGDSRAVLSRNGVAVPLSFDHKPYDTKEKDRIENAGGHVKFNRVNVDLAVSRALGDFLYKRCETVPDELQAVTAFPEVITEERQVTDEFIVLACDGIWDVMSSQEVVDKVHDLLRTGPPPPPPVGSMEGEQRAVTAAPDREWNLGTISEVLIDHCLHLGSRDNMSVIILMLKPSLVPRP